MDLNNKFFFLILALSTLFFYKYFLYIKKKIGFKFLIDDNLSKPQAFHVTPVSTVGGVGIFLSFLIFFFYSFFFENFKYFEYFTFCSVFFFLGLLDDLRVNLKPKFRLLMMISSLIVLVIFNNVYIEKLD